MRTLCSSNILITCFAIATDEDLPALAYVVNEFGWDNTDWATPADLEKVLTSMKNDPKISGDLFWALQAHNDKFGWQPIPANVPNEMSPRRAKPASGGLSTTGASAP